MGGRGASTGMHPLPGTHSFQVDFAPLRGLENVRNARFEPLSDEHSGSQVVKDNVLKSIFVA